MKLLQKYSIKKSLLQLLPFVMLMAPACKKNKVEPTLPEPIEQHDVVIDWTWGASATPGLAPSKDSIRQHTSKPDVRHVYINLVPLTDPWAYSTWEPRYFDMAADTLESRFEDNKVRGSGFIRARQVLPDTVVSGSDVFGIWVTDSVRIARLGYHIKCIEPPRTR